MRPTCKSGRFRLAWTDSIRSENLVSSRDVHDREVSASRARPGPDRDASLPVLGGGPGTPAALRHPGIVADLVNVALAAFDRDMHVAWMNQSMIDLFGLDAQSIEGRSWYDLVPPMRERQSSYERTLAGVSQVIEETAVPFPEGPRYFDVRYDPLRDERGDVVGLLACGLEVTRRVQLKKQLHERMLELRRANAELQAAVLRHQETDRILTQQRDFLESVLDNIPVMLILYDEDGRVQLINTECEKALGFSVDDWRIGHVLERCYPDPQVRARMSEFLAAASSHWADFKTHTREGRVIDVAWYNVRLTTGGSIGIGQDVTERRKSERQILEIESTLQQRIGRDLHDDLGQSLVAVGYMLDQLLMQLANEEHPRQVDVRRIREHVIATMDQTRTLARDLSPVTLVANNLEASLEELATRVESLFDVRCTVQAFGTIDELDSEVGNHLYRIAQEAVSNAIRHGAARNVEILLNTDDSQLCLEVVDDGEGLPKFIDDTKSLGIRLMRYRASILGATLEINDAEPCGCRVRICLSTRSPAGD